jgi:energy-coupling factor transporter ATP-binding protein EcfA2
MNSVLLVGRNGSGKSSVRDALHAIRQIGTGRPLTEVISPSDFSLLSTENTLRFELEGTSTNARSFKYHIAIEVGGFNAKSSVVSESFSYDGELVFERDGAEVSLVLTPGASVVFDIDQATAAISVIEGASSKRGPIVEFRQWLLYTLLLAPIPFAMRGESSGEDASPKWNVANFGAWYRGLVGQYPAAGGRILEILKEIWPELTNMVNQPTGKNSRSLELHFARADNSGFAVTFDDLSDGEKCLVLSATVIACAEFAGPILCFWDEPDNYLSIHEVGEFMIRLRKAIKNGSQLIATSHNGEAIRKFSNENTLVLYRDNHANPTRPPKRASEISSKRGIAEILAQGEEA